MTLHDAIEDMDVESWAALTKRAAADVVAAANRLGQQAPKELVALAELTEQELIERRKQGKDLVPPRPPSARPVAVQQNEARHTPAARAENEPKAPPEVADSVPPTQFLTIPIPPIDVRPATRRIENALTALHQLDYVLEVGAAEEVKSQIPLDVEMVRSIASMLEREATSLPAELDTLSSRFTDPEQRQAADDYVQAATATYSAFMHRIRTAAERLQSRDQSPDAEIVALVTKMLKQVGSTSDTSPA